MSPRDHQESTSSFEIQPQALELIQRAEIDMQVATAKKYPRDLAKVKRRMLDFATLDEETAESCFYTLSRGGKTIQGPSVRLAEIAVACYQNLRAASRVIDNNGKIITCQGVCHDLENNTLISVEVQRRITKKDGRSYDEDMQVVAGNAGNSIAFRNAVFKVVPGALLKPVYEAAKKVAVGDASTLTTKRLKIISKLNAMQVDTPRILAKLGRSNIENIGLEDLEVLIGLGTAIKDGDTTVDESFPVIRAEPIGSLADRVKAAASSSKETSPDVAVEQTQQSKGKESPVVAEQPKHETKPETGKPESHGESKLGPVAVDSRPVDPATLKVYAKDALPDAMDMKAGTHCIYEGQILKVTDEGGDVQSWVTVGPAPAAKGTRGRPRNAGAFDAGGEGQ